MRVVSPVLVVRFLVSIVLSALTVVTRATAQDTLKPAPSIDSFTLLETMRSSISGLRSTTLEAERTAAKGADIPPNDGRRLQHVSSIQYGAAGPKYFIDYVQTNTAGVVDWSERAAYDGSHTRNLRRHSGFLYIERGNIGAGPMCHHNVLFDPFTFLLGDRVEGNDPILTLIDFHTPEKLRQCASQLKLLGTATVRDHECIVVEAPGGRTRYTSVPYDFRYRVYLARDQGMYPIRWEKVSYPYIIHRAYDVHALETIDGVRIPKVAIFTTFQKGIRTGILRQEIQKITINPLIEESQFTIDSSMAANVSDQGRWIRKK